MLPILNGQLKNNTFVTVRDPLEQFNFFEIFVYNFEEIQKFNVLTDRCPFNLNKMGHNLLFTIDYYWNVVYYALCEWLLNYIPTPLYIIVIGFIGIIAFIVIVSDTDNSLPVTNAISGELSISNKHASFVNFLQSTFSSIIGSVLKSNTSLERNEYLSILYFLFLFIFTCNVFGLMPYTFTLTSSFMVTIFLAATHFIGINIIGAYKQSWHFLNLFLPSGVPLFIAPFLVIIEVISYFAKVLSLSIRLFANMMSGHALLKILIGFSWVLCSTFNPMFVGISIFPWLIVTLILFLEALIAFLQAYVFVVLISIYLNDVTSSH